MLGVSHLHLVLKLFLLIMKSNVTIEFACGGGFAGLTMISETGERSNPGHRL